ncbi:MAG: hypothetical protein V1729_06180 [Candidatus Woesearchaeota archaeon]
MVEDHTKNKLLMIEGAFAVIVLIFLAAFALDMFFPTAQVPADGGVPGIVGFVPLAISNQQIDLFALEPKSFLLFSERTEPFLLTSFRLTGQITGTGRVEITLDNGIGQELLVYSNIKDKQTNLITGMATAEEGSSSTGSVPAEKVGIPPTPNTDDGAWFKIMPQDITTEGPSIESGNDKQTVSGHFKDECGETCYINMKMQTGLYYTLKVKMDPGTEVRITELTYTLDV